MSYQLKVKPLAEEEIRQAADWYELEKTGLGDDFIIALDRQFTMLRGQPFLYAVRLCFAITIRQLWPYRM